MCLYFAWCVCLALWIDIIAYKLWKRSLKVVNNVGKQSTSTTYFSVCYACDIVYRLCVIRRKRSVVYSVCVLEIWRVCYEWLFVCCWNLNHLFILIIALDVIYEIMCVILCTVQQDQSIFWGFVSSYIYRNENLGSGFGNIVLANALLKNLFFSHPLYV